MLNSTPAFVPGSPSGCTIIEDDSVIFERPLPPLGTAQRVAHESMTISSGNSSATFYTTGAPLVTEKATLIDCTKKFSPTLQKPSPDSRDEARLVEILRRSNLARDEQIEHMEMQICHYKEQRKREVQNVLKAKYEQERKHLALDLERLNEIERLRFELKLRDAKIAYERDISRSLID